MTSTSLQQPKGLIIAGLSGGSGKSVVSVGVTAALTARGRRIAPFKKGPDYIDASWLSTAAEKACRNLDLFLMSRTAVVRSFVAAAQQADVVGAAELSQWMRDLFPKGEAKKREIMELAMTAASHVHHASDELSAEVSGARTMVGVSLPAHAQPRAKRKGVRFAVAAGVLLVAGAAAWGLQQRSAMSPPESTTPVAEPPVVAEPSVEAEPAVPPSEAPAPEPSSEPTPTEKVVAAGPENAEPSAVEASAADKPQDEPAARPRTKRTRTSSRKTSTRKPRVKRTEQPLPEPIAKGLPGHVKIVTKGHSVQVYKGSKLLGKTPATITLPAGRHMLRLKSLESGESLTLPVNVVANATKTISLDVD